MREKWNQTDTYAVHALKEQYRLLLYDRRPEFHLVVCLVVSNVGDVEKKVQFSWPSSGDVDQSWPLPADHFSRCGRWDQLWPSIFAYLSAGIRCW